MAIKPGTLDDFSARWRRRSSTLSTSPCATTICRACRWRTTPNGGTAAGCSSRSRAGVVQHLKAEETSIVVPYVETGLQDDLGHPHRGGLSDGRASRQPIRLRRERAHAIADDDDHIRDMIKAVLFTAPGERVNRPDFDCGIRHPVFAPLSDTLTATTQHLFKAPCFAGWGRHPVDRVAVEAIESSLFITVTYSVRATSERAEAVFEGQ